MIGLFLVGLLPLLLGVFWIVVLFRLGTNDKRLAFFVLLYFPWFVALVFLFVGGFSFFTGSWLLLFCFLLLERIFWGLSLFDAAGFDRPLWFVFIFLFPIVGWLFYRLMLLQN